MSRSKIEIPSEKLALYDHLIGSNLQIERKGKTTPYTSLNGHMFSFLSTEGTMGLRLSDIDREGFIKDHKTNLMEQHGRVMKEYVAIPEQLLQNTTRLSKYLDKSLNYVASLKPKPSKKRSKILRQNKRENN